MLEDASTSEGGAAARLVRVDVSADRLSARVSVEAGPAAGDAELERALQQAGVIAGVDMQVFSRISDGLREPGFAIAGELIARGTALQHGEPGRFESPFLAGLQPGHLREDGTLDFHDRELLKPVHAGDVLGRVWPARAGRAGYLLDGTPLPVAAVAEVAVGLGPGAQRDAAGVVTATRAGIVLCKALASLELSIDVVDQHVHDGAVDLRSGHLHMLGSLIVKGDVHGAFRVYASGDVEIRGSVDNGHLYAGGSARIQHGVVGAASSVCAEGDLTVRHAESATLHAGRALHIRDAVHARLFAPRIEVAGRLRGGVAAAESSAVVHEAGSPQGVATELAVAEPLELPIEAARRDLERAKAVRGLGPGASQRRGALTERGKGGKVGRAHAALRASDIERLARRAERRKVLASTAFVQVGLAHAGVLIRIGDQRLLLEHELRSHRFSLDLETRQIRTDRTPR
jgi:uncharacterized protein (DUF342 family)